jgi:hypothetical protein
MNKDDVETEVPRILAQECLKDCNGLLFVFFTEPGVEVSAYSSFIAAMQLQGYALLAVELKEDANIDAACSAIYPDDPDRYDRCLTLRRSSLISGATGADSPTGLVQQIDSAIQELAASNMTWQKLLDADRHMSWSQTVIAGSGAAAPIALGIAQKQKVFRACTFHIPKEIVGKSQPPSWLNGTFKTPLGRLYMMTHKHDAGKDGLYRLEQVLQKIGIAAETVSWTRPKGQLLYASLQGESCTNPSNCLVRDPIPVDGDGDPIYLEAWKHICVAP